jgi:DNA polymerase III epsilon subunit-like protein
MAGMIVNKSCDDKATSASKVGMLPSFEDDAVLASWRIVIRMPSGYDYGALIDTEERIARKLANALGSITDEVVLRCGERLRGAPCVLGYVLARDWHDAEEARAQVTMPLEGMKYDDVTVDEITPDIAKDVLAYLWREGRYATRETNGRLYGGGIGLRRPDDAADGVSRSVASGAASRNGGSKPTSVVAIALETTGLDAGTCEVVRLAAYGNHGDTMYDRTFGVEHPEQWSDETQKASEISPNDVTGLPTFRECLASDGELASLLDDADIIIAHNALFVVEFLSAAGVHLDGKRFGDTCACFGRYAMQHKLCRATRKLTTAAHAFKIPVPRHGHTNEKAYATYAVWLVLVNRHSSELMDMEQLRAMWVRKHARKAKRSKGQTEGA